MKQHIFFIHNKLFFFMIVFFFIMPKVLLAEEKILIDHIRLANTRDDLFTYFSVKGAFTPQITQAIQEGVPTTFSFSISLYKVRNFWKDKKINDIEITSTITYNSLKKEYIVTRFWKDEKPVSTKSFEKAKAWMVNIDNLQVVSLTKLIKGEKYQMRLQAEIDRTTLPFYLHNIFFFLSFWDVKTDWYLVNFTY